MIYPNILDKTKCIFSIFIVKPRTKLQFSVRVQYFDYVTL